MIVISICAGKLADDELLKGFGNSKEFTKSVAHALQEKIYSPSDLSNSVAAAYQVAGYAYEIGTDWGKKVGWLYGSKNQDVLTGLMIHK
ncbi:hypothetical protein Patl1_01975 [Pistacia atlantica]|uniref:Uncharacterized protein n=1 Tax=Pistacia atlantica TaxID=434234 RepID=A0ACC1C6H5_9ROSI|nr:hypothetical protein Patl1_01975 [Pistacia atlantica]